MRLKYLTLILIVLAGCSVQQMQKQYVQQNSATSPNFDSTKVYTLAVLPPDGIPSTDTSEIEGLRDFAAMTMIQTGHFSEVERSRIDVAMKEQEFGTSGVVDAGSAAKLGKVLGADAVMLTSIVYTKHNDFFNDSPEQRETEVNVRVVSSSTAEVLYRGHGQGSSFNGELEAWQSAFQLAVAALKHK